MGGRVVWVSPRGNESEARGSHEAEEEEEKKEEEEGMEREVAPPSQREGEVFLRPIGPSRSPPTLL